MGGKFYCAVCIGKCVSLLTDVATIRPCHVPSLPFLLNAFKKDTNDTNHIKDMIRLKHSDQVGLKTKSNERENYLVSECETART